jgi:UDP-3-O-[3-hydroxymyristoyl] glucosamine N-acyltransferase
MIIGNDKPIRIIGYPESSMTDGALQWLLLERSNDLEIITPETFLNHSNKSEYQYLIAFSLDMNLRKTICDEIDNLKLDCITYIHESSLVFDTCKIGKGVFIGAFSFGGYHSTIEDHCWVECYCMITHHVNIGRGSIIHGGSSIAGRTKIGKNCTFGFKSSAINNINITDNVTIGAFSNVTKPIHKPGRYVGSIARYIGE